MSSPTTPSDDRDALLRFDLVDTARRHRLACAALLIPRATTALEWGAIAQDFKRAATPGHSHDAIPAEEASLVLAHGALDAAVARLANSCGLTPEAWLAATRGEMQRAARAS
mgnify:CR=1 FL=1